jgi:hypothetical protein
MNVDDKMKVRLTVVGHASRRWRGARSTTEAERLNQQLSEARAQNLRRPIDLILKQELPGIEVEVPATGVGSSQGFPLTGEDNAALDRSVEVGLEASFATTGIALHRRPAKIYVPSRFWELRVVMLTEVHAVGAAGAFMRLKVRNPVSGRELTLAGRLFGGNLNPLTKAGKTNFDTLKNTLGSSVPDPTKLKNLRTTVSQLDAPVGQEVVFSTKDLEDFTFFVGEGKGQFVRLLRSEVGLVRKREISVLQFTGLDTHPSSLTFEYKKGWSWISLDVEVLSGFLQVEGDIPADFVDGTRMVVVPMTHVHNSYDGMLVSFPSGKAGWSDLTPRDQKSVSGFVRNAAKNIGVFTSLGYQVNGAGG